MKGNEKGQIINFDKVRGRKKAIEYLGGKKFTIGYRILFVIGAFVGSVSALNAVWDFADIMNGLMTIPNLISLLLLSGILVKETRKHLWRPNGLDLSDKSELDIHLLAREKRLKRRQRNTKRQAKDVR